MRASALKTIAITAFAATAAISSAYAADMAPRYTKAPPPMVEIWTWDKFYIGLNGGYSWGRSDTTGTFYNNLTGVQLSPTQHRTLHLDGAVFGGQIGKNWQNGQWVFGLEAMPSGPTRRAAASLPASRRQLLPEASATCLPRDRCRHLADDDLQPGDFLVCNVSWAGWRARHATALLYVTGGLAVAGIKTDGVISGFTGACRCPLPWPGATIAPIGVGWSALALKHGWAATGPARSKAFTWITAAFRAAPAANQQSAAALRLPLEDHRRGGSCRRELPFRRHGGREILTITDP